MKRDGDKIPVVLESGRWTIQRNGETPLEAQQRLMGGEDLEVEGLPENIKRALDAYNVATPRFRSTP